MVELYLGIKWLHIICACIGFGSNVTHLFWIIAANRDPVHRANILRLVKKIDDRMAVPSYIVAVTCGSIMWFWQWPGSSSWLIASVFLTALLATAGIMYGPFMKKWIRLANGETEGAKDGQALPVLARRLTWLWGGITGSAFLILFLMVRKPMLW
ncbi:MAG: DUF2269 family protein [Chromatiales bacterium]|nr:MAG: DUF2269 family protein [Chromatiales bacterium]